MYGRGYYIQPKGLFPSIILCLPSGSLLWYPPMTVSSFLDFWGELVIILVMLVTPMVPGQATALKEEVALQKAMQGWLE